MASNKRKHSATTEPSEIQLALLKFFKANNLEKTFSEFVKEMSLDRNADFSAAADISTFFKKPANGAAAKSSANAPPAKKAKPESSSDSDSSSGSDSDSDDDAPPPAKKAAPAPAPTAKSFSTNADSDSDSDSSDDEEPAKVSKPAAPVSQPTSAKKPAPAATKKAQSDSDSSSSSGSDSSDSDSDDESEAKPAAKKSTPAAAAAPAAKKTAPAKAAESSSSSSGSDSESSDDEDDDAMDVDEEEEKPKAAPQSAAKKAPTTKPAAQTPTSNGQQFKAYVKGLPWKASDAEVADFFQNCPDLVKAEVPIGDDGRSSGTAYVTFSSREGLDKALELDGQYWPGTERWLKIVESTDKPDRKSFGGNAATPGEKPEGCDTVFVGNLPWDVDEDTMRSVFSAAGEISSVRFATNAEDGSFRGFGHVSFYNADDVDKAIALAGTDINGRAIRVDYAPPRARKEGLDAGGRGGGRGRGRDGGRGGRGRGDGRGRGTPSPGAAKKSGAALPGAGKKITFD